MTVSLFTGRAERTPSAIRLAVGGIPTGFCLLAQGCGNAATPGVWGCVGIPQFPNPNGVASFPHKPLIPFHAVFAKKRPVFIPE